MKQNTQNKTVVLAAIKHLVLCTPQELLAYLKVKGINKTIMRDTVSLLWDDGQIKIDTDRKISLAMEEKL